MAWAGRLRASPIFFGALANWAAALLWPLGAAASPILPAPALERPADGVFRLDASWVDSAGR